LENALFVNMTSGASVYADNVIQHFRKATFFFAEIAIKLQRKIGRN